MGLDDVGEPVVHSFAFSQGLLNLGIKLCKKEGGGRKSEIEKKKKEW